MWLSICVNASLKHKLNIRTFINTSNFIKHTTLIPSRIVYVAFCVLPAFVVVILSLFTDLCLYVCLPPFVDNHCPLITVI